MSLSLPEGALRPAAHPDTPPPGTELPPHYAGCFGCGHLEGGMRMRFVVEDDLTVASTFPVERHHQGAPGIAHGGVVSAAFDEALGLLAVHHREPAVTASLQTQFRRPVPVGSVLHLRARIVGREGRKIWCTGEARLDAPDGPLAADATALFVVVPVAHFAQHGTPE